jgi:hypothetical protein
MQQPDRNATNATANVKNTVVLFQILGSYFQLVDERHGND